jgi:parallel beta-helix repeat protein
VNAGQVLTIQNYPGEAVWFDGSVPVTNWTQQGATWVATGWTAQFDSSASYTSGSNAGGFVNPAYPMAAHPDQVFLDGASLAQVAAGTTPKAGQFAVDYAAHTITIGSDPTGHALRASDLDHAFVVGGTVTLRGFGVRRYATPLPQIGTVFLGGSVGGNLLQNLDVEDNATQGIGISVQNTTIDHVTTAANGMSGMMANTSNGLVVENSLLTGNNTEHFNSQPSAAGIKIGRSANIVIRNNDVIDNIAETGIWTDITCTNFRIVNNTVAGNTPYGIETELSDTGIVANNTISGAKYGYTAFDTGNVQVYNNAFSNDTVWDIGLSQDERRNTDPATQTIAPWLVRNVIAANNIFGTSAAFQFYALDKATNIPASSMKITVNGNEFPGSSATSRVIMVGWGGSDNVTVTYYRTPAALDSGLNVTWANLQPDAAQTLTATSGDNVAVPLPDDVAAAIGVAAGTRHIGPF